MARIWVAGVLCLALASGCATARATDRTPAPPSASPPGVRAGTASPSTPATAVATTSPVPTKTTPTASTTPFAVNGIVLVNAKHSIPASYVPPWSTEPHGLSPEYNAALTALTKAAAAKGLTLKVESAYRSYSEQAKLFKDAVAKHGYAEAAAYNALPGCSEHQTGLAADLTDAAGAHGTAFNNTPEARFLAAHAAEYGFIVRYPKGAKAITGYEWEPWHLRYVGTAVAAEMAKRPGLTLEEYLGQA